ncbi:MAG: bifunctional oligoribonuclease/PAP phosphatase NrnA [Ignavibacteriaceae bacterium]
MIDFNKLKDIIHSHRSFLLTTHVNPDADAIGSEIALLRILKKLNKEVFIYNHSKTPYNLLFLDPENAIKNFNPETDSGIFTNIDVLVALDFNRSDRIVSMQKPFNSSAKFKICIDHHHESEKFVDELFVDTKYSATSEILFDFIKKTKLVELDKSIADPIYAGIMTDTGSFRFERTTSNLHLIVAELIDAGVNPGEVYDKIYDQSKFSKIKLLGKALNSLTLTYDNQIGYMVLTQLDFNEVSGIESDTDGFVNHCLSVENVKLGLLFIELKNGFKVSFRSKGNIPANKLAGEFGGGGHTNAAGARFHSENMNEFITIVLKKAQEYINNYQ